MRRLSVLPAWLGSLLTVYAAAAVWRNAVPAEPRARHSVPGAPGVVGADTTGLASATAELRSRNPFRLARRPTDIVHNPWQPPAPPTPPPPAAPRPVLTLAGILGGPPWLALIEGIPGAEGGALLALGGEAQGVRFKRLGGDTVFLVGFDTTWALTPRRSWP